MRRAALLLAALAVAACAGGPSADPRAGLTRAALDQTDGPRLFVEVEGLDSAAILTPATTLDDVRTWQTADGGATVSLQDGLVTATRGLGDDLMTSDIAGSVAAAEGRVPVGQFYPRFQSRLGGDYAPVIRAFQCQVVARRAEAITIVERRIATTRTDERCVSPGLEVDNTYWQGADGVTWRARQWAADRLGYILTERLR